MNGTMNTTQFTAVPLLHHPDGTNQIAGQAALADASLPCSSFDGLLDET